MTDCLTKSRSILTEDNETNLCSIWHPIDSPIDQLDKIIANGPDPDVRKAASEVLDYLYFIDHERIRGL